MDTLTVQAIKDAQVCGLWYRFRYEDDLPVVLQSRSLVLERFENTLKRVASFFFYKRQADVTPSYVALLNRWEKLWFPKNMTAYDVAAHQHEIQHHNLITYSTTATGALERFREDFADTDDIPMMIDEPFIIPIGDTGLRLEGRFDLVLRSPDKTYRIIKWSARPSSPSTASLRLDMAAYRMAFEHRNDEVPENVEYYMYDLASDTRGYVPVETPRPQDLDALYYWAQFTQDHDHHVPRRGYTAYCKGCSFDEECADFNDWPNRDRRR